MKKKGGEDGDEIYVFENLIKVYEVLVIIQIKQWDRHKLDQSEQLGYSSAKFDFAKMIMISSWQSLFSDFYINSWNDKQDEARSTIVATETG